jgi:GTP-binding protein
VEEEGEKEEGDDTERVILLGRPNVGKSSLMNALTEKKVSFVSDQPGTTRDLLEGDLHRKGVHWTFVDSAGVRKKSKVYGKKADPVEIFSIEKALQEMKRSGFAIFVVEACLEGGLRSQDHKLLHLIRSSLIPTLIVVNKWDLVRKDWTEKNYKQSLKDDLGDLHFLPILFVSAKTGYHLDKIFQILEETHRRLQRKIPTPKLNRWLHQLMMTKPPRVAKRGTNSDYGRTQTRYVHIQYAVQVGERPPTIQFFCNAPHAIAEDDKRFLESKLRENFGLNGIPVKMIFRKKNPHSQPIPKRRT